MMNIRGRLTKQQQMSDAFVLSAFLAFSGGFQDAYTYIVRDAVFANAQTGNVVLMSTYLLSGDFFLSLRYFFPLLAFSAGVFVTDRIRLGLRQARTLHWRQAVVLLEMLLLFSVGFMPGRLNTLANVLVSFSCAMQLEAFRKVEGRAYASTMCIGNLRSGVSALSAWLDSRDEKQLKSAGYYFGVILIFAVGAGLGGVLSARMGVRTIWVCPLALLPTLLLMGLDK